MPKYELQWKKCLKPWSWLQKSTSNTTCQHTKKKEGGREKGRESKNSPKTSNIIAANSILSSSAKAFWCLERNETASDLPDAEERSQEREMEQLCVPAPFIPCSSSPGGPEAHRADGVIITNQPEFEAKVMKLFSLAVCKITLNLRTARYAHSSSQFSFILKPNWPASSLVSFHPARWHCRRN